MKFSRGLATYQVLDMECVVYMKFPRGLATKQVLENRKWSIDEILMGACDLSGST